MATIGTDHGTILFVIVCCTVCYWIKCQFGCVTTRKWDCVVFVRPQSKNGNCDHITAESSLSKWKTKKNVRKAVRMMKVHIGLSARASEKKWIHWVYNTEVKRRQFFNLGNFFDLAALIWIKRYANSVWDVVHSRWVAVLMASALLVLQPKADLIWNRLELFFCS